MRRYASLLLSLALTGCAVGPTYQKPTIETPATYRSAISSIEWKPANPSDTSSSGPWWQVFDDEKLNALEQKALNANQELEAAMARVDQARAIARVERAELFPEADLNPSMERFQRTRSSFGGAGSFLQNNFRAPFDLSYELDLWGKVRRSFESARAQADASEASYRAVLLMLSADVARTYFLMRELDAEKSVLEETIELRRATHELVWRRFEGGLVSGLDVARAKTELASAEAEISDVIRRRSEFEHALAVLCGEAASTFIMDEDPLDLDPPSIPPGIPSTLLERRPDISEAERHMAAANAEIGVATAAFFPVVRLTGMAGYESAEIDDLFHADSLVWSIGPSVSIPLFRAGRAKANLEAKRASYDEAVADYRQSILVAFKDVEDALSNLSLRAEQASAQSRVVEGSRDATKISQERYRGGLVNYLEVVDAERQRLQAELGAVRIKSEQLISTVLLIKALGGSWEWNSGDPPEDFIRNY